MANIKDRDIEGKQLVALGVLLACAAFASAGFDQNSKLKIPKTYE